MNPVASLKIKNNLLALTLVLTSLPGSIQVSKAVIEQVAYVIGQYLGASSDRPEVSYCVSSGVRQVVVRRLIHIGRVDCGTLHLHSSPGFPTPATLFHQQHTDPLARLAAPRSAPIASNYQPGFITRCPICHIYSPARITRRASRNRQGSSIIRHLYLTPN